MMGSFGNSDVVGLSEGEVKRIEAEIRQAATDVLEARDFETSISCFSSDAIVVSNDILYAYIERYGDHLRGLYDTVKEISLTSFDEMHISVISREASTVTVKFRCSFTSMDNEKMDAWGVWTSLYVLCDGSWKIRTHHESFYEVK